MTWQGGGGGGLPPGISGDGQIPGGLDVAGALTAGDPNAASVPSIHNIYGNANIYDSPGNAVDGDDLCDITQLAPLSGDNPSVALVVARRGTLNGHAYTSPTVYIGDDTGSSAPVLRVTSATVTQLQVDGDGVCIHGKLKSGASTTHTLGAYSGNSVPIYDESGTLLGYMPLYA